MDVHEAEVIHTREEEEEEEAKAKWDGSPLPSLLASPSPSAPGAAASDVAADSTNGAGAADVARAAKASPSPKPSPPRQRKGAKAAADGLGSFDGGTVTPSGMETPYSTSVASMSSVYSSDMQLSESEDASSSEHALDPSEGLDSPQKLQKKGKKKKAGAEATGGPGLRRRKQLTQDDKDLFLRLEREWREEDESWARTPASWWSSLAWLPVLIWLRIFNLVLAVVSAPVGFFARVVFGVRLELGSPFWDVPLQRRKQTATVMLFLSLLPLTLFFYFWTFVLLIFPLTTLPTLCYVIFIYFDKSAVTGKRRPFVRFFKLWRHFAQYFPLRLIRTAALDPTRKYVMCYHPHGIISLGAFGNFATNATNFSGKFPGISLKLLTLEMNFWVPVLRELLLWMGVCSASRKSCNSILQRGPGSAIMLVVGGAAESLDTQPGTYRLTLGRKGFVRVALDNGADLVPVLGFGENDVFDTMYYPPESWTRRAQEYVRKKLGFAVPVFFGRGVFSGSGKGLLPHRKPIIVVVGKPIRLPHLPPHLRGAALARTAEGRAIVDKYHDKYVEALRELWDLYKERWALHRQGSLLVRQ